MAETEVKRRSKHRERRLAARGITEGEEATATAILEGSKWQKAVIKGAGYTKEQFPDLDEVVYWIRQVIGLVIGLAWGIVPITGAAGIISFGVLNAAALYIYYARYLEVDLESYGTTELLQEGFMPSFGLFLLSWTITYSALHTDV